MIVLTLGEPSGISYEIFLKTFPFLEKTFRKERKIYIGSKIFLKFLLRGKYSKKISLYKRLKIDKKLKNIKLFPKYIFGKNIKINGYITYLSLKKALKLLKFRRKISKSVFTENILKKRYVLITLPLTKKNIPKKDFIGHTEFLGKFFKSRPTMLMGNKYYTFAFFTTHLPLREAIKKIKKKNIKSLIENLKKEFPHIKRIGVFSLNPHGGEEGKLGEEEIKEIIPAIEEIKKEYKDIYIFCKPSDTILFEKADVYIALFHDQALIPLKLTDKKGIYNITLGLPIFRISPGHGTAYDIAGKGICKEDSFLEIIKKIKREIR